MLLFVNNIAVMRKVVNKLIQSTLNKSIVITVTWNPVEDSR